MNTTFSPSPNAGDPAVAIRDRAESLFRSRRFMCAEAILISANEVFDGGLSRKQAAGLAAALPEGLGGSGCLCGAVSGAALALGLILSGKLARREIRRASKELHRIFTERHGSTCCRVLIRPVKEIPSVHFDQCAGLTAFAAETAARLILEKRPELAQAGAKRGPAGLKARISRLFTGAGEKA